MAHKYQYKCEGKINLQREGEEFPTTVWIETNLYEPTIKTATDFFESMLSKYAACYGVDSKFSKVGFEVTAIELKD